MILPRLDAAISTLRSIILIDAQRQGIIDTQQEHLAVKQKIIDDYRTIDTKSQRIDTLGEANVAVFREQHLEDKNIIGDLQKDLNSCRSNQKWVFGTGALVGGAVAWKIKGSSLIPGSSLLQQSPSFQLRPSPLTFDANTESRLQQEARRVIESLRVPK